MKIYTRWGEQIFETEDYDEGWEMGSGAGKHCMCDDGYEWPEDTMLSCVEVDVEEEYYVGHSTTTLILDTKRKIVWKAPIVHYLSEEERTKLVQSYYDNNGYQPTLDYCMELYRQDKISFTMKTELANMVTQQQMLPKRLRKWVRKIK